MTGLPRCRRAADAPRRIAFQAASNHPRQPEKQNRLVSSQTVFYWINWVSGCLLPRSKSNPQKKGQASPCPCKNFRPLELSQTSSLKPHQKLISIIQNQAIINLIFAQTLHRLLRLLPLHARRAHMIHRRAIRRFGLFHRSRHARQSRVRHHPLRVIRLSKRAQLHRRTCCPCAVDGCHQNQSQA